MTMKRLCVFCGSRTGNKAIFAEGARALARGMLVRGLELVFGAGHIGLMGVVADAVLASGGRAIGVIPQALVDRELAHPGLSETHIVASMHERKALMAQLADGFIALPGGYGTADEFFEMLTWRQLEILDKPTALYNIDGFFDPLLAWIDRTIADDFLKPHCRDFLLVGDDVERLLDTLVEKM